MNIHFISSTLTFAKSALVANIVDCCLTFSPMASSPDPSQIFAQEYLLSLWRQYAL